MRTPAPETRYARLLRELDDATPEVRESAQRHLRNMEPDAIRACLADATAVDKQHARWSIGAAILVPVIAVVMLGLVIDLLNGARDSWLFVCLVAVSGGVPLLRRSMRSIVERDRQRHLVEGQARRVIENLDDVRTVGLLIDTLTSHAWASEQIVDATREAIARMLPRLTPADGNSLDEEHRTKLYEALHLHVGRDCTFHLAVLHAIAQVGDEQAVPYVARLAHDEAATPNQKRVRTAARECLALLEARLAEQRAGKTLLRPADATPDADTRLLRPARGHSTADQDVLVRPTPGDRMGTA